MGQVFVGGGQQPAVRVQVDPAALAGRGLTLEDVRAALGARRPSTSPRARSAGRAGRTAIGANDQLFGADAVPQR